MERKDFVRKQKMMEASLRDVKTALSGISGVVAVGIGLKESGRKFTEEISYRVYVPHKKHRTELRPEEIIPPSIDGIPTDVLTPYSIVNDSGVCGDERMTLSLKRPLRAGIAVSGDSVSYGTLGWFGKLRDGTDVLLTNKHVLYDDTNQTDLRKLKTGQPRLGDPAACFCYACGNDNVIGESLIGIRDIHPPSDTSVDCAIARINPELARDIVLRITNDSTEEVLSVSGTASAVIGDKVRKIGARSGYTRGTVIHIGDIAVSVPPDSDETAVAVRRGQVLIIPDPEESYQVREGGVCKPAFTNSGDSGAVILNQDNRIIALNWGGDRTTGSVGITIACKIQNVLDKLSSAGYKVTLSVSPPAGDNDFPEKEKTGLSADPYGLNILGKLRDSNKKSLLYWLYERHNREIMSLITGSRPVGVAWQRNQGPAYVAAIISASGDKDFRIPFTINSVSREALLKILGKVLTEHGSDSLKADIKRYRKDIMKIADQGRTIEELALILKKAGLIDEIPSDVFS